jgi:serine/threonine protein phosphatase PrpC
MSATAFRLTAATGIHRGDRAYQQDQVEVLMHERVAGCLLAVLADGMGGKSGGRKAADQVLLTARQLFDRFVPGKDERPTTAEGAGRRVAPDDQADRDHRRGGAAQHGGRLPAAAGPALRRGACGRFTRLPLPRRWR